MKNPNETRGGPNRNQGCKKKYGDQPTVILKVLIPTENKKEIKIKFQEILKPYTMKKTLITIAALISINCYAQKTKIVKTVKLKSDKVYTYNTDTLRWALDQLEFVGAKKWGKVIYYGGNDRQSLEALDYLVSRQGYVDRSGTLYDRLQWFQVRKK